MTRIFQEPAGTITGTGTVGANLTDLFVVEQVNSSVSGGYQTSHASLQLVLNAAGQLTSLPSAPVSGDELVILRNGTAYIVQESLVGGANASGTISGTQLSISGPATITGSIYGSLAPGYGYSISNLGTVTSLATTDYIAVTHSGSDAKISLPNLANALGSAYAGTITITSQPMANQIYQRDYTTGGATGQGYGAVTFGLTLSAAAQSVQYQLIDATTSAIVQGWTALAGSEAAGSYGFTANAVSASLHWYRVQFRCNSDSTSTVTSTNPFAMGELVAFGGQSLAVCMVSTLCSGDQTTIAQVASSIYQPAISGVTYSNGINNFCAVLCAFNSSNGYDYNTGGAPGNIRSYNSGSTATEDVLWNSTTTTPGCTWLVPTSAAGGYSLASSNAAGVNSAFCVQFMNRLLNYWGVPIGMVGYAVGSTSMTSWQTGFTAFSASNVPDCNNYTAFESILALGGGKYRCLLWMQGHQDAIGNSSLYLQSTYNTTAYNALANLLSPLFATTSGAVRVANTYPASQSAMQIVFSSIPNYSDQGGGTNPTYSPSAINYVREVYQVYGASIGAQYVDAHDIAMLVTSGQIQLHPSQAGCITMADHFFRAYMKACTTVSTALGDGGPKITAATRAFNSNYVGLTISQPNGGTALTSTGTLSSLFAVYQSGTVAATYSNPGGTTIANQASGGYAVNSATIANSGSIILNVAGTFNDAATPIALDVWFERAFDGTAAVASAVYDNVATDGLPNGHLMMVNPLPVTAAAPTLTLTITSTLASQYAPGGAISVTGTYTNGTPSALSYGFAGPTGSVTGASATIGSGSFSFSAIAPTATGTYYLTVVVTGSTTIYATSSTSFTLSSNTISVNTVATQTIASAGTITGGVTVTGSWGVFAPGTLYYETDGATHVVPSSQTISSGGTIGSFSFITNSGLYAGEYDIFVADQSTGSNGTSNAFAVVNTGTTAGTNVPLPTLSTSSWAPILHLDAANPGGTLFQGSSSSSAQVVNGSQVGFFQDSYGNQYSQSNSSQQPVYAVNIKNGMPGLRFAAASYQFLGAVSTSLASTLYSNSTGFGILIVCTHTGTSHINGNAVPLSWGNSGVSISQHLDPLFITSSGSMIFTYSGGSYQNFNMNGNGYLGANTLNKWVARNTIPSTGTYYDYIDWDNGGTIYAENGPYNNPGGIATFSGSSYNFGMIGASLDSGTTNYGTNPCNWCFDGWIHEIIVYLHPITSADATSLITYATSKWGN